MKFQDTVITLDIGSTKIAAIISGYEKKAGHWKILGIGIAGSEGIKKGRLVQPSLAVEAIKRAIQRATDAAKVTTQKVVVSLPMTVCQSYWNNIAVRFYAQRKVRRQDIEHAVNNLSRINVHKKIEHIKTVVQQYTLDKQNEMPDPPVNFILRELALSGQVFYFDEVDFIHWQQLLKNISYKEIFFGVSLEALAAALTPKEFKKQNFLLLDIGGSLVQVGLFQRGKLLRGDYATIAGNHLVSDIMYGLNLSAGEARRLLFSYGKADGQAEANETISVLTTAGEGQAEVSKNYFYKIISARLDEIFSIVNDKLQNWEKENVSLPQHVLLGGGVSQIEGIGTLAEKHLKKEVHVYKQKKELVYKVAEGLLISEKEKIGPHPSFRARVKENTKNWFKEFA